MKTIRFLLLFSICFVISSISANRNALIVIDSRIEYQHVSGFGGFGPSPTWAYWLTNAEIDKMYGKGENQLGYNIMRLYIANKESGWSSAISTARRAKLHGAYLFASPWSPPAAWKSNNDDSNGGYLLESRYGDWANFLNGFVTYMDNNNIKIDGISIQNEPDWTTTYQSCIWTGQQFANFLKNWGSTINSQIIAPEGVHFTHSLSDPILNDPEACAELDILGGHFYGWNGASYPLAISKGKEVWMTEYLINERQEKEGKNIDWANDGFLFARSINDAMLANMSAWVHYALKRYYGCLGDGNYGTIDGEVTKRGYILSHYAKNVSGTTRIKHFLDESSGSISSSAYISVTGDSVIVMVLNPTNYDYNMSFTLPFNSLGGSLVVTTETDNMKKTAFNFQSETYEPSLMLLPLSVNTFIFEKSSLRDDLPDIELETDMVFSDRFDDYAGSNCIPPGWRAVYEGGVRDPGEYSLGPRLFFFSTEGQFSSGLYFRGSSTSGTATYGLFNDNRLTIEPGKYRLSYSAVGWKEALPVTASVLKTNGRVVESKTLQVTNNLAGVSGASMRINNSIEDSIIFDVSSTDNFLLRWSVPSQSAGFAEMIIGNIKLVKIGEKPCTISVLQSVGGTAYGGGEGYYGKNITLSVIPDTGYVFTGWYENEVLISNQSDYSFKSYEDRTLTAMFEKIKVNMVVNAGEGGEVSLGGEYEYGEIVTVEALPFDGYFFGGWEVKDQLINNLSTYSFTIKENISITAIFSDSPKFAVISPLNELGSVTGTGLYTPGSEVTLTATANYGYHFVNWKYKNETISKSNPIIFTIDETLLFEANYSGNRYNLTVESLDSGIVHGEGEYAHGTVVELKAEPNRGYYFAGWYKGDSLISIDTLFEFSIISETTLKAIFEIDSYTVSCRTSKGGVVYGDTVADYRSIVTVKAFSKVGYSFDGWYLDKIKIGQDSVFSFILTENIEIEALFLPDQYRLELSVNSGNGIIIGDSIIYHDSLVVLTAVPDTGYVFMNWMENDNIISGNTRYSFIASAPRSLEANFKKDSYYINLSQSFGGKAYGSGLYYYGDSVTLSAVVTSTGYKFDYWTKDGVIVSYDDDFTFIMRETLDLKANFSAIRHSVSVESEIGGVVQLSDTLIRHNRVVNLTIYPDPGYEIDVVLMNGEDILADIQENQYSINVLSSTVFVVKFRFTVGVEWSEEASVEQEYFDLTGRRVQYPTSGIYFIRERFDNGIQRTRKILIK